MDFLSKAPTPCTSKTPTLLQKDRGLFITIEGIDGAGKSSHVAAIANWVRQQGHECLETREPGGTVLGEQLRQMILHHPMSDLTELLLIFAARAEHIAQVIMPALERGVWVVCDRFNDSTLAYQGGGRGMNAATLGQLSTMIASLQPDLTLIFDIELHVARLRRQARHQNIEHTESIEPIESTESIELADKFETAPTSFALAVQAAYRQLAKQYPERCVLINGGERIEQVRQAVLNTLNQAVGKFK